MIHKLEARNPQGPQATLAELAQAFTGAMGAVGCRRCEDEVCTGFTSQDMVIQRRENYCGRSPILHRFDIMGTCGWTKSARTTKETMVEAMFVQGSHHSRMSEVVRISSIHSMATDISHGADR